MSSILSKESLNDFITPSQVCINPIKNEVVPVDENVIEVGKEDDTPTKVNITLQDCLACSGCVTTSEELLLEEHSYEVFLKNYKENLENDGETTMLVSISPTCRISLMSYLKLESLTNLDKWFVQICEDIFAKKMEENRLFVTSTQVGKEISNRAMFDSIAALEEVNRTDISLKNSKKPFLTAVCPGVVLYIEKQHNALTDHFIKIKPEMSTLGNLVKKHTLAKREKIYHLSIMPCFDKKLESSKIEEKDVDCVLTPKELINMLIDNGVSIKRDIKPINEKILDPYGNRDAAKLAWSIDADELEANNSSGGYAFKYLKDRQSRLEKAGSKTEIKVEKGKNNDMTFYRLLESDGQTQIAASCELYGFKNLQNLIRKLDSSKSSSGVRKKPLFKSRKRTLELSNSVDITTPSASSTSAANVTNSPVVLLPPIEPRDCAFIELMACPAGCINGGGLLVSGENSNSKKKYEALAATNGIFLAEFSALQREMNDKKNSIEGSNKIIGQLIPDHNSLHLAYQIDQTTVQDQHLGAEAPALFESW
ncbi:hypothetical protein QEN19_002292 [Hanseniaspora menglaensis]